MMMGVNINITGSSFVNGFSQMGGAIYLSGGKIIQYKEVNIFSIQWFDNYKQFCK